MTINIPLYFTPPFYFTSQKSLPTDACWFSSLPPSISMWARRRLFPHLTANLSTPQDPLPPKPYWLFASLSLPNPSYLFTSLPLPNPSRLISSQKSLPLTDLSTPLPPPIWTQPSLPSSRPQLFAGSVTDAFSPSPATNRKMVNAILLHFLFLIFIRNFGAYGLIICFFLVPPSPPPPPSGDFAIGQD